MRITAADNLRGYARPRTTLGGAARVEGVTLFTGVRAALTIRPVMECAGGKATAPGPGLWFLTRGGFIPAVVARAERGGADRAGKLAGRRTVLAVDPGLPGSARVQTVEHVLSALTGLGVTDAVIEVDGPEVPIGDGSARPFVEAIAIVGVVSLWSDLVQPLVVRERIVVESEREAAVGGVGGRVIAEPLGEGDRPGSTEYIYQLDYGPGSPLPPQEARWTALAGESGRGSSAKVYAECVAPARTFSLLQEAVAMRSMGMFNHLTPKEMLVLGPDGPVENTLRFPDEPARHKLLDLIGDLALVGRPLIGRFTGVRGGHALNHELACRLLAAEGAGGLGGGG